MSIKILGGVVDQPDALLLDAGWSVPFWFEAALVTLPPRVIIGPSSGQETIRGAIYNKVDEGYYVNDYQIELEKFSYTRQEDVTLSLGSSAHLELVGQTIRVLSDGPVTNVTASSTTRTQVLSPVVPEVKPITTPVLTFNRYADGTFAEFSTIRSGDVLDGVVSSNSTRLIFNPNGTWNPSCVLYPFRQSLTGISFWNSTYGTHLGGHLITKRHVIWPAHGHNYTTYTQQFLTEDGEIISRVASNPYSIPLGDTWVYVLDSDVPDNVTPLPIFPSNFKDYLPNLGPVTYIPVFLPDRDHLVNAMDMVNMTPFGASCVPPSDVHRNAFYTPLAPGTSGKPVLVPYAENKLALLKPISAHLSQHYDWSQIIAAADAGAGISTGYTPEVVDMTAFTKF